MCFECIWTLGKQVLLEDQSTLISTLDFKISGEVYL